MLLYIASIIIFFFVSISLFWRAPLPLWLKGCGVFLVLAASLKYEIYQWLGGAFFSPSLPRPFLLFMEALYGALIILFFLLLLFDLYLLGNRILKYCGIPVPSAIPKGWIKCGLCALALTAGAWGVWQAVKVPSVRTVKLDVEKLPASLNGFTLVQLSDLHIGPMLKKDWLQKVVDKTNALNPDLILITGDFIDGYAGAIADEVAPLAELKAKYGVFGITGNHEYYWNMEEWRKAIEALGITMLHNSHVVKNVDDDKIVVVGLADLAATRFGLEGPNLEQALKGAQGAFSILLDHQPRNARENLASVDLQLSGHTHGGHMFFLQPLIARFNNGFVKGLYNLDNGLLYVHPGTGLWNGFSNRIGVPSEITRLVLEPAS